MHPILSGKGKFGLYLLAWMPLAALLVYVLGASGRTGWAEAATVVVPLCFVYAFVCLSPYYLCRLLPLSPTEAPKLVFQHALAALVSSLLWIALAKALLLALTRIPALAQIDSRFRPHLPLLFGAGVLLYLLSVAVHYMFLAVETSRVSQEREMGARILAREAELKALKAQINPHFLFNSLHSISALTSLDPAGAREMCVRLSDFLRSTLGLGDRQNISLEEELSLAKTYLDVEEVRFGPRLNVEQEIEEGCRSCLVPPLLLQPLVENAVKHGVASRLEGTLIRLEAHRKGSKLLIMVENTFDPESPSNRRNGMGLSNVKSRLNSRYGEEARLDITVAEDRYRVELSLPADMAGR